MGRERLRERERLPLKADLLVPESSNDGYRYLAAKESMSVLQYPCRKEGAISHTVGHQYL